MNKLFYGDNLKVLREGRIAKESVDLVYLDPPFNSNRSYNVIFAKHAGTDAAAQIEAFDDTWHWTPVTEHQYEQYALTGELPSQVADALTAFRTLLGENDAMAYLVNMAPRLVELHQVLKPTGSIYLHCDPTMSHYLKILLDTIFGPEMFRDEIIWKRHNARSVKQAIWPRLHDVLLYYGRTPKVVFNETKVPSGALADPHDIVTGPDGKRYRTKDLTAPETRQGETGQPWHGMALIRRQQGVTGESIMPRWTSLMRKGVFIGRRAVCRVNFQMSPTFLLSVQQSSVMCGQILTPSTPGRPSVWATPRRSQSL